MPESAADDHLRKADKARRKGNHALAFGEMWDAALELKRCGRFEEAEQFLRASSEDNYHIHAAEFDQLYARGAIRSPESGAQRDAWRMKCAASGIHSAAVMYEHEARNPEVALDRYLEAAWLLLEAARKNPADCVYFFGKRPNEVSGGQFWSIMATVATLATSMGRLEEYQPLVEAMRAEAERIEIAVREAARTRQAVAVPQQATWPQCARCRKPVPAGRRLCATCSGLLHGGGAMYHRYHPGG